ncbi:MAG: epoxyqueuosine reductase QueH [Bacillota bacterium]|jgi:predicted adenine nucleotide alpha hydrolase (AANH) superfamily ATPase
MKLLLHACCGPCASYSVEALREAGHEPYGYFYNPNIHPYQEYQRRLESFEKLAEQMNLPMLQPGGYDFTDWLRQTVYREEIRCRFCYQIRLEQAARIAKHGKFDAFTTTLLISPFQQHDLIRQVGEAVGEQYGIPFYYQDFRPGFRRSVQLSRDFGLYRQQYCGCIYSEVERYAPRQKAKGAGSR